MAHALTRLPDIQLDPLRRAYAEARSAKRRQALLGVVILVLMIAISAWTAEVRPATLWRNIDDFFNYFIRLFFFENGAPVWTDFGEWFWLALSAAISILMGVLIMNNFPSASLWLPGLLIAIELLLQGWTLLFLGFAAKSLTK